MKKKALVILTLVGILGVALPSLNTDAAWKTNSNGRYYTANNKQGYLTGWKKLGKYKYYFAKDGYAATGWKYIDKNWYFFSAKGRMLKSTWVDSYYLTASGKMAANMVVKGIQFDKNGNQVKTNTNETVPETEDQKPVSTWITKDNKKFYYDYKGKLAKGYLTIKNKTYYLDPDTGAMKTGVVKIGKKYYYFNPKTGAQQTGWRTYENKTYYFNKKTKAAVKGWQKISKQYYYFDSKGVLQKNKWIDNNTYRVDENGIRQTGWVTLTKYTYYFNTSTGKVTKGANKIGKYYYYFSKKGRMQKSKWVGGKYYQANGRMARNKWVGLQYVNGNGKVTKTRSLGFFTENGKTYYRDTNYELLKNGWHQIDSKWYYFDKNGARLKSKWIDDYYVDKNGIRVVDKFKKIKGNYYLFQASGQIAKGLTTYKGATYYLDPTTGVRKTGFIMVDGKTYYFQPSKSGAMAVDVTLSIEGSYYTFDKTGVSTYNAPDNSKGAAIAEYAQKFIGYSYKAGGSTDLTKGVDCSGFTMLVHKYFGINIPRTSQAQAIGTSAYGGPFAQIKFISEDQLLPGDIICYYNDISHVGIYIGNGKIVHASNSAPYPQGGIKVSAYNYTTIVKIVRYW